eukprot:1947140-Ditylum_brightwellii.AAC.1
MNVETFLDNVESFHNAQVKANKWAKAADEQQGSVFVGQQQQHFEMRDCYNCGEKGGTSRSHISPNCSFSLQQQPGGPLSGGRSGRGHGRNQHIRG